MEVRLNRLLHTQMRCVPWLINSSSFSVSVNLYFTVVSSGQRSCTIGNLIHPEKRDEKANEASFIKTTITCNQTEMELFSRDLSYAVVTRSAAFLEIPNSTTLMEMYEGFQIACAVRLISFKIPFL